ncbi:MAG: hypothetical protein ABSA92_16395 [Candidatus Bathyarchaeia archaeon]
MAIRAMLPITFGMVMAILLLWGTVLGFVNGYNAAIWVLILISGVAGLTLFGIISEEWEGTDHWEPRRTSTRTSSRIVHIERPRHFKRFEDDFD